jgi:hypothetical protein
MIEGIIGAVIGYVIIITLLVWFVISSRGNVLLKVFAVAFSVYYALCLFPILHKIEGWPSATTIPDGSQIISIRIREPSGDHAGAFYIWCNVRPQKRKQALYALNPAGVFTYVGDKQPRAFKMPYDKEMHRKILEAKKRAKKNGGWLETKLIKGKELSKQRGRVEFKVINPITVLTKEVQ